MNEFLPHLQYYVYVLLDPRDGSVFYVGKGKQERALAHVAEVISLINSNIPLESKKHLRIKEILDSGQQPKQLVVARFDDEKKAFAVESVLINYVYDFTKLTNAVRGHGAEFVRKFGHLESDQPGLDIPERYRLNDGAYRDRHIAALRASGAYEFLERIRNRFTKLQFDCREFQDGYGSFDPGASNGQLGFIVHIQGIDFLIKFTQSCEVGYSIANTPETRNDIRNNGLERIKTRMGEDFHISSPLNSRVQGEGRYLIFGRKDNDGNFVKIKPKPTFDPDNLEGLFALFNKFKEILNE